MGAEGLPGAGRAAEPAAALPAPARVPPSERGSAGSWLAAAGSAAAGGAAAARADAGPTRHGRAVASAPSSRSASTTAAEPCSAALTRGVVAAATQVQRGSGGGMSGMPARAPPSVEGHARRSRNVAPRRSATRATGAAAFAAQAHAKSALSLAGVGRPDACTTAATVARSSAWAAPGTPSRLSNCAAKACVHAVLRRREQWDSTASSRPSRKEQSPVTRTASGSASRPQRAASTARRGCRFRERGRLWRVWDEPEAGCFSGLSGIFRLRS
mmetsp:Transcript_10080/g.39258  ORF Transcript_10080/g.39258 Transcript_10080/m.39258 type:complete len:271 (+) Transcript_10080:926-1738(+)